MFNVEEIMLSIAISEETPKYKIDLKKRTFEFAVDIVLLSKKIPGSIENNVICHQIVKAGTSVGANYEEAQAASSKADFKYKIGICLKEARESHYWLRLMEKTKIGDQGKVTHLLQEALEIKSILGTIYVKVSGIT